MNSVYCRFLFTEGEVKWEGNPRLMYDPASRDLIRKLEQFTAVRERDLSGCAAYVRLLNRDLPMFDSIWLDALVQRRLLSPFQADSLSQGREASLKVGEYLLIDQVLHDPVHVRYLAQHTQTRKRFLIDEYIQSTPCSAEILTQLGQMRAKLQTGPYANEIVSAVDYIARENSLLVVHPYFRGLTVRELLIRRGRFPEQLLKVVVRQLLRQLSILEQNGIVHGDLRISNLLLSRQGTLALLNTGIVPHLSPHWTLNVPLPFESYDGFAPEMIRNGRWTHQTDLYSAGCLLWQIACGRSPVYSADSLLKLRNHASRSIPDVREYAPEVDPETAQIIFQLTRNDHSERPASATEILAGKRREHSAGSLIKKYVKEFEQPISKPSRLSPRAALLTTACLIIMLTLWGMGKQLPELKFKQLLLSITSRQTELDEPEKLPAPKVKSDWEQTIPLPPPDEQGVLKLTAGRIYQSEDLASIGPLQIVTEPDSKFHRATVLIADKPWRVSATHLSIKNVTIEHHPSKQHRSFPAALLVCQSLTFEADRCIFKMDSTNAELHKTRAVAWKPLSTSEANAGRLTVSNCQFYSPGTSIMLGGSSRRVHLENCLKTGAGDFIELSQSLSGSHFPEIQCEQLTLRQSNSFVNLHLDKPGNTPVELTIDATNCVFDLTTSSPGLITLTSPETPASQIRQIDLLGQILLLPAHARLSGWWNPTTHQASQIEFPGTVEGVLSYEMKFAGRDLTESKNSELIEYHGPRWNSVSPGIDLSQLKMEPTPEKKTASRPTTQ